MTYLFKYPILRIVADILFVFYITGVIHMVFFPLPTLTEGMRGHNAQLIPFKFIYDICTERTLRSVMQVLLNIVMTVPFGIYLEYRFGLSLGRVALCSLAFSFFIEFGQLTGLFFLYPFSYRLFDIDDLIMNTLGGLLGAKLCSTVIPVLVAKLNSLSLLLPGNSAYLH